MLKKRLAEVGSLIEEQTLIDIGTDHGYLIIDLIQKGIVSQALAVEITQGPLDNVTQNVKNHRLSHRVDCVLSDGLTKISNAQTDRYQAVSICGMGGALIAKILTDSKQKLTGKTLYLQPNNGEQKLRETLVELGFKISDEKIIIDNDIYYEIIKAVPGTVTYSYQELYFGPINIRNQTSNFRDKYTEKLHHLMRINEQIKKNNKVNQKIINEIETLKEVVDETVKDN